MNRGDIKLVIDQLDQVDIENHDDYVIRNAVALIEGLGNKVAEQAAVIEKLIPALRFDSLNMSLAEWRDVCKVAEVARTDSEQVLADWMREQLGEPINMVEEKIREAYERVTTKSGFKQTVGGFILFKAGYLAMLNSLEFVGSNKVEMLYRLPEGVTRDRTRKDYPVGC